MTLFFLLFAVCFTAFPVVFLIASTTLNSSMPVEEASESPFFLYIMVALFFIIGIVFWFFAIRSIINGAKSKIIEKEGETGVGHFIRRNGVVLINDRPFSKLEFSFKNKTGEVIKLKSLKLYPEEQVNYLEKLQEFKIKYLDDKAVIVEDLSDAKIYNQFNKSKKTNTPISSTEDIESNINDKDKTYTPNQIYDNQNKNEDTNNYSYNNQKNYICKKCGYSQDKPGKCEMCGAKVSKKN